MHHGPNLHEALPGVESGAAGTRMQDVVARRRAARLRGLEALASGVAGTYYSNILRGRRITKAIELDLVVSEYDWFIAELGRHYLQ